MRCFCTLVLIVAPFLLVVKPTAAHPGSGIVVDDNGTIYFVYGASSRLWKVAPQGEPAVLVQGGLDQAFRVPHHLVLDENGHLYTASDSGSVVWKITPQGDKQRIYPPVEWDGQAAVGLGGDPFTIDANGNIIAVASTTDPPQTRIVRISRDGKDETIAGGARGFADGTGAAARFSGLHGATFAWGPGDWLYLTDNGVRVRRIALDGEVETILDLDQQQSDNSPSLAGLTVAPDRTIYVAAMYGRRIYEISPDGAASVLAGTGERGGTDGPCDQATFDEPVGVALDDSGRIVVLEYARVDDKAIVRLRRIDPAENSVETLAIIHEP